MALLDEFRQLRGQLREAEREVRGGREANAEQSGTSPTDGETVLTATAPAGASALEVASTLGFAPGDLVRINPGGPTQEDNTVVGLGSLLLGVPVRFSHQAGERVVRLSGTPTPSSTPSPSRAASDPVAKARAL